MSKYDFLFAINIQRTMPSPNAKIGKLALPSFSRHARVNEFPLVIWLIENVAVVFHAKIC